MGLGLHGGGLGVAKWLLRHGAKLTVTDTKSPNDLAKSIGDLDREHSLCRKKSPFGARIHRPKYVLGRHNETDFSRTDMVIRNPAVPREHPLLRLAERNGVPVESDVSLFFRLCPFPVTAVTGTKGKSTTTALLSEICRQHDGRTVVGGNIRISPMDGLDGLLKMAARKKPAVPPPIVLELSSWQLESLEKPGLSPDVAVVTNVMRDHLNRYRGKMSEYAAAKELIVRFQKAGDVAILNAENPWTLAMARRLGKRDNGPEVWRFSASSVPKTPACFVSGNSIVFDPGHGQGKAVVSLSAVKIPGEHNIANVLAAAAAALAMGIPLKTVSSAIRRFGGVPDRLEKIAVKNGIAYVNDTTATTPDASIAAMSALSSGKAGSGRRTAGSGTRTATARQRPKLILIAGGADKDLRFGEWAKVVSRSLKGLILLSGPNTSATPKMIRSLKGARNQVPWVAAGSMEEAVAAARAIAVRGDTVLLSPACASFGMFVNEFDRGDRFREAVGRA